MQIDLNKIESPNILGELLRHLVFVPKNEYGCYHTFELEEEFIEIDPLSEEGKRPCEMLFGRYNGSDYEEEIYPLKEEVGDMRPKIFKKDDITVAWYWDRDGTLYFKFGDKEIINNDCKKDYEWEWIK